ncbi:MAG: tryptophan synthase alpha chain, partial [Paraglaciecola sp.]
MTNSIDRYGNMFKQLDAKNEGAFVPFVMVGDPDIHTSV